MMERRANADLDHLVEIRNISKTYGTTTAVDNVSLAIEAGRSIALAGRNGAGKSTIVRLLTGLSTPDSGEIRFAGKLAPHVSDRAAWRSMVACVYQKSTIIPDLTVGENLFLNDHPRTRAGRILWNDIRKQGRKELETWGLKVDVDQRAGDLNVGHRQLLEIARALRQGSRFIILDEPTAQLAIREIQQLFEHVDRLKAAGITFLFISHHLQEIYEVCERVAVMRDGRLVADAAVGDMGQEKLVAAMVGDMRIATSTQADVIRVAAPANCSEPQKNADAEPLVLHADAVSIDGIVEGASVRIRAGERVGLAGLAGSGKSEFGQAIAGLLAPSGGRISVEGKTARPGRVDLARDIGIAYVPADRDTNGFCSNLSVEENIALPVLHRMSTWGFIRRREQRNKIRRLITQLQIKVRAPQQSVSELSGGNQQKVVMARALASDPKILVLEVPTAGVDIASKSALFETIRATKSAVLLISDEIDELAICDRVLVMFEGAIVQEFTVPWQESEMVAAIEGLGR